MQNVEDILLELLVTFSHKKKYCVLVEILWFKDLKHIHVTSFELVFFLLFRVHLQRTTSACYCFGYCYVLYSQQH